MQTWAKSYLTYCGLMISYDIINTGQHWLRSRFAAWRHQAITWTNDHLSSNVLCGIYVRQMSQAVLMNLIRDMYSKITLVKLLRHLPGANELTVSDLDNARPKIVLARHLQI